MRWHMKVQTDDLIDVLSSPAKTLLFDNCWGLTKKREDGLDASNVNCEHGRRGCQMRSSQTVLNADCLGVHNPLQCAGAMEELAVPGCCAGMAPNLWIQERKEKN